MEKVVLGASETQRLSCNLFTLELVGVSQMDKGMADCFTCQSQRVGESAQI